MAAVPLRRPRPYLFAAALAAVASLALTGARYTPPDAPGEATLVCMDGWGVAEMVHHLEARGLGLCAIPTRKGGALVRNAFLSVPVKTFEEVERLIKEPAFIAQWEGVVYCEEYPRPDARNLPVLWGDCCRREGPFVFFGDHKLLGRIHEALVANPSE